MPDFAVSVAIRGDDQISDNLKRLSRRVDRFGRNANRSFGMASRAAGMFKAVLGGVLTANVISRGFAALSGGAREVTSNFIEMDHALTSAGAKFQLSKLGAEQASVAMQSLKDAARATGAATEFTATQAAQGLEFLAMAGFSAEQAIAALPLAVDLATATNMDLARATDIASDALGAFGLESDNAAIQAENLKRVTDVFAQTTASANVDMENLFETMKMGAPIMTTAGQSLESFAAMSAVMANAGIKGSLAGTVLKNTIQRLVAPVGKAKTTLRKLNVEIKDQHGNMRDVADILKDFNDATKDMGKVQRTAAISTVFGARAVSGISTILDKGIPTLKDFRKGLDGAGDASKRMADEMRQSLQNRLAALKSGLIEVGLKIFDAFQDKFPNAIDTAIEAVRNFDVQPIIDGIKTTIGFVKDLWDWFKEWKGMILLVVGAIGIFKAALAMTGAVEAIIAVMTGAVTVTELWAGSQWALNFAMLANPITWIIAIILALIAVVVLLIVYWDDLKKVWVDRLTEIYAGTDQVFNGIVDIVTGITNPIQNVIISIGNWFGELWHNIKKQVASAVSFALSALGALQSALGFDLFDIPSQKDLEAFLGVDKEYVPTKHLTEEETRAAHFGALRTIAGALGADKERANEATRKAMAPNRSATEAQQQSIDLSGQIDIWAPENYQTTMSSDTSVNGNKADGVDWRNRGGRNGGK